MTHGTPEIHPKWQTRVIQDSLNKQSITNSIEGVSRALLLVLCTRILRLLRLLRLILNHSRNAASLRLLVKLPRAAKSTTLLTTQVCSCTIQMRLLGVLMSWCLWTIL